jgi:hypothetical protein
MKCAVCKKPLSDPLSVEAGMGPVCRGNHKEKLASKKQLSMFEDTELVFNYELRNDILVIWKPSKKGMSLTNAMEVVIRKISTDITLPEHIIYEDSDGIWDGVKVNGEAVRFYPISTKDINEALKKVKARNRQMG